MALHLNWSVNKTRRIRRLSGITIPIASKRLRPRSAAAESQAPENILGQYAVWRDAKRPQDGQDYSPMAEANAWGQDFTYLRSGGGFCYLAVVMALRCRQIVGWRLGTNHSADLTHGALADALSRHRPPAILHSDRGSEYLSLRHRQLCRRLEIRLSCSSAGSPWQNGFVERFFGQFKLEFGQTRRYKDLAELHEAIALYIHYYNTKRIHLALKTTPAAYASILHKVSNKKVS